MHPAGPALHLESITQISACHPWGISRSVGPRQDSDELHSKHLDVIGHPFGPHDPDLFSPPWGREGGTRPAGSEPPGRCTFHRGRNRCDHGESPERSFRCHQRRRRQLDVIEARRPFGIPTFVTHESLLCLVRNQPRPRVHHCDSSSDCPPRQCGPSKG